MPVFLRAPDANQLILTDYVILSVSEELAVSFPKNIADANQSDSKNENEVVKNTWNWKYRSKSGKNDEKNQDIKILKQNSMRILSWTMKLNISRNIWYN